MNTESALLRAVELDSEPAAMSNLARWYQRAGAEPQAETAGNQGDEQYQHPALFKAVGQSRCLPGLFRQPGRRPESLPLSDLRLAALAAVRVEVVAVVNLQVPRIRHLQAVAAPRRGVALARPMRCSVRHTLWRGSGIAHPHPGRCPNLIG